MSNIDKRALREAAEKAGSDEWCAFIDTKSKTYAVHTPADNRCGDVVKWAGFDGQQRAAAKAKFIAAANPAVMLALLDELEAAESGFPPLTVERLMREKDALEKRVVELEARMVKLPESYEVDMCPTPSPDGEWYSREDILAALVSAGVSYAAAAGKGE